MGASPIVTLEGRVLECRPHGENHESILVLDPEAGPGRVLFRASLRRKKGGGYIPDLLDRTVVVAEIAQGGGHFLKSADLVDRPTALARDYGAFSCASRLASILARNAHDLPEWHRLAEDLEQALQAWSHGAAPLVVLLKTLYRIAKAEGLPVREHWRTRLSGDDQAEATRLINSPLSLIGRDEGAADSLCANLERWLASECSWHVPPPANGGR